MYKRQIVAYPNFYKKFIDEGSKNYVGYDDFINQTKDIIFVPYLLLQKIIETANCKIKLEK